MNIHSLFSLEGKTALVTGCRRGIGLAMAIGLAEAGADIIGVSANLEKENSEVGQAIRKLGKSFKAYPVDLDNRDAIYTFLQELKNEDIKIDILVNNAGTILRKPAAEHPDEYWDKVLSINLDSQFILARDLGAEMLKRKSGKIIFTASLLSFQGGINVPGYAASKGAIASLVKALANEWAGQGVNVNAIAPGYIATDNTEALRNDENRNQAILARIPANRWGTPQDLVGTTIFLASQASDYIHGTILTVDGGWMGR
jgi:2-deoxy-D-gluconate 3-dehydrogenase